jgi:hypothetical protein
VESSMVEVGMQDLSLPTNGRRWVSKTAELAGFTRRGAFEPSRKAVTDVESLMKTATDK